MNLINKLEIEVGRVVIKKTAVAPHFRENKKVLYNFVIAEYIMRDVMAAYGDIDHINLHLDKSMSKSSREAFDMCTLLKRYHGRPLSAAMTV